MPDPDLDPAATEAEAEPLQTPKSHEEALAQNRKRLKSFINFNKGKAEREQQKGSKEVSKG